MSADRPGRGSSGTNLVLLVSVYALEAAILLALLALYKKGARPISSFLTTPAGTYFGLALAILVVSTVLIVQQYRKRGSQASGPFGLTIAMNVITVVIIVILAEITVRAFVTMAPKGPTFANAPLLPRSWESESAHYRRMLSTGVTRGIPIYEADELLGWTIASNRSTQDGLYHTSAEGIRSPRPDMSFAEQHPGHRVALVGDSYTFGLDVSYEESWGHHLERELGAGFQVLNFGVPGYGLDQAYLRYERDTREWNPKIVVFGIYPHDLVRTMSVYSFITFPDWESPYAKPRFTVDAERLALLNVPLLRPSEIFAKPSIADLPFLEYERNYNEFEWEQRLYHRSYLARLAVSKFPRWEPLGPNVDGDAMKTVNGRIIQAFLQLAKQRSSTPVVVYLPSPADLTVSAGDPTRRRLVDEILDMEGIRYEDLTSCLLKLAPSERFVAIEGRRGHYTPQANEAIAKCLHRTLESRLGREEQEATSPGRSG